MNRNYAYSENSLKKINSTNAEMVELCHAAMDIANTRRLHCPDFGISSGFRSASEQYKLFTIGRTKAVNNLPVTNCDGTEKRSVHQDGYAIDFYAYVDGKANYEPSNLALIATCFFEAASNLRLDMDWGGSFRSISDAPHIEIRNWKA